jgi:FdrA protein
MMDNDYRIRRMRQEYADTDVGLILVDLVLGEGAHPDPASEIALVTAELLETAKQDNRPLEVVCIIVGTDEDPQDLQYQVDQMEKAGAIVYQEIGQAITYVINAGLPAEVSDNTDQNVDFLKMPLSAINVGLDIFTESLRSQGAEVIGLDWRPPAGGDDRLAGLLAKMK